MSPDEPSFRNYAKSVRDFIGDSDLSGFNLIKFDLPFLESEFQRSGIDFSRENRRLIDVQTIYHKKEPRTLEAAYYYYCGKTFDVMHTAEGDATAAAEILDAQLENGFPDDQRVLIFVAPGDDGKMQIVVRLIRETGRLAERELDVGFINSVSVQKINLKIYLL